MRELKFQGYLKKENKMFPVCDLNFNGVDQWAVGISSCGRLDCGLCEDHYERADVEVMQYTGLKDKNGREVYEGDILQLKLEDYAGLDKPDTFTVSGDEVYYADVCYLQQIDDHIEQSETEDYIEVIGNIHENPELLAGDSD